MAEVSITIPHSYASFSTVAMGWNPPAGSNIPLGASLSEGGNTPLFLGQLQLPRDLNTNIYIALSQTVGLDDTIPGPDFSPQMEAGGTITFVASNNDSVVLTGISDATEPYLWTPSNLIDVRAFSEIVVSLTDRSLTVIFNDRSIPTMKFNGVDIAAWKFNGVDIAAAKYNGVGGSAAIA